MLARGQFLGGGDVSLGISLAGGKVGGNQSCKDIWEVSALGRGNSECKGPDIDMNFTLPEAEIQLTCLELSTRREFQVICSEW